ncbi:hypothetical protein HZC21_06090 [Candidatus Peregrinibacteria bacterium]|nr:hypothetical protein [Candidatus Peregrinibacteria bacterium]
MLQKIFLFLLILAANLIFVWYGNFTGKLPAKGVIFGLNYDSIFVRAVVTQFQYVWVLIIANIMFTLFFKLGFEAFKNNFLSLAIIWLVSGPIAALIFNTFVLKERVSFVALAGVVLLIAGSVLVIAQKEIAALMK